jgi:ABC-type branched-subunit amino acid transport system ATPase component/ABC-type branched-subunit amino acid transport system permease subunit
MMGFHLPLDVIVLGAIIGMTYGLLAVGLVLIYRTNRIINFAHGQIGAFGAAVLAVIVLRWHVPYYLALLAGLAAAGLVASLAEVAVVRRLRNVPRVMSIVATLGVGQFLLFFSAAISPHSGAGYLFPSPPGLPHFRLGSLELTRAYVGMLIGGPLVVLALVLFLRRSRIGLALRCASANAPAARLAGISASAMSTLAWAIAGVLSAFTAVLVLPASGFVAGASFGPELLLRALTGAVVARMQNIPVALATGIGLGVVEQLLFWNYPRSGLVELMLFVIIVVALLLQRGVGARSEERGSWAAMHAWRPIPDAVRRLPEVRLAPWALGGAALAVACVLPLAVTNSAAVKLTEIMAFAIVGLSVMVITGLAGQLSLGQFALGGVGAVVSFAVSSRVGAFPLAFLYAGLVTAAASLIIGLPALRIRGLLLTATTLGFALVASAWLLPQSWMLGGGVDAGRPIVFGRTLDTGKAYYFFGLAVLVVAMLITHNVRRGGIGRLLVAVRDNEDGARAFGISSGLIKLQGFALAGFIAGVGGAMYGHLLSVVGPAAFSAQSSVDVVAMTVIGGMSLLASPLLGAFYIIGIPAFVPLDSAGLAATQLGWLVLILYLPGGISQGLEPLRNRYVAWAASRHDVIESDTTVPVPAVAARQRPLPAKLGPLLEAANLRKRFGGVEAVKGVSLEVHRGEIVGLIGPNGAGKTTTFELLGGFTRPDEGWVSFEGVDISALSAEERARLGLIRSFQDAALFPSLSVLDVARLAFERVAPTQTLRSVLGLRGSERDKDRMARQLVGRMGLNAYRDKQIQELSTGTRRIAELGCLIALEPALLLLDEPSSGVAQRETEALGRLLGDIHQELGLTMLVIEHDIPLVMSLSHRIIAMDAGTVISVGTPAEVRADPLVVEAYLGGSIEAVERSDHRRAARV